MNPDMPQKRLVVLTADRQTQFAIRGILSRHKSLGIRPLGHSLVDYVSHPENDPGVLRTPGSLLATFARTHAHAIAVMDREGCGRETASAQELEDQIEADLRLHGWADRAAAVVIDPELEIWVWSDSPHVEETLGWSAQQTDLRQWLGQSGFSFNADGKPTKPKEAMQAALRTAHVARSSALYATLAGKVSLTRCTDRAFLKLKAIVQTWFPGDGDGE